MSIIQNCCVCQELIVIGDTNWWQGDVPTQNGAKTVLFHLGECHRKLFDEYGEIRNMKNGYKMVENGEITG